MCVFAKSATALLVLCPFGLGRSWGGALDWPADIKFEGELGLIKGWFSLAFWAGAGRA